MSLKQTSMLWGSLALFALLISCASEPVAVSIGTPFNTDGNELTIETIEQRNILVNDDKQLLKLAPEGQHYLYIKVHNPSEEMVFIKAMKGEEKLEAEDLYDFSVKIGSGYEDAIYLVNDGDQVQFSLTTPSDAIYTISDASFPNKDDRSVAPQMAAFISNYTDGVNLLTPLKEFIAVENVYDVAKERGADVPTSPMVKGMEITYISKDGTTYQTKSNFLGSPLYSTIQWEGDHIASFEFQLP